MAESMILKNAYDKQQICAFIMSLSLHQPMRVEVKQHRAQRSTDQNSLMHKWFWHLSVYLIKNGRSFADEEWVKDAMKHTFLGYQTKEFVNVITGEVTQTQELKKTSECNVGELTFFMDQVYAWSMNIGCLLPIPEDNDYWKFKRLQEC